MRKIVTMDPVQQIKLFNSGRDVERLAIKYSKMRASDFAFLRGTCHLFYDRLPQEGIFKNFPLVWACGDLHLENFGTYKGDNRLVYFDLNDFDEAALAPVSFDLIRMLTSIWVGIASVQTNAADVHTLCETFLNAYSSSLATGKAYWVERETAQGPVRTLLTGLKERSRLHFLDSRTEFKGKNRVFRIDGIKALAASKLQRAVIADFMSSFAKSRPNPDFYKLKDVVRRIAGTGSLGVDRFAVLIEGKGSPDGNYLLDLKLSTKSTLASHVELRQPRWPSEAHRVVELQNRSQAVPMAFLQPVLVGDDAYVMRELQPSEDRISFEPVNLTMIELQELLVSMGNTVAWAHLRSAGRQGSAIADELIEFSQRKKWQNKLIKISNSCAQQVRQDSATFNDAYDNGVFNER